MVSKVMYAKIQSLKRQGFNRSDIADKLKLTRKTVGKYFKMNEAEFMTGRTMPMSSSNQRSAPVSGSMSRKPAWMS
jgi:orotate phosphoribosyltransferase-like protein